MTEPNHNNITDQMDVDQLELNLG